MMEKIIKGFKITGNDGIKADIKNVKENDGIFVYEFCFEWTDENRENNDFFEVAWQIPMTGIMYQWMPGNKYNRTIRPDWSAYGYSMISVNSPVLSLFDGNDKNCYSWCLSECKKLVYLKNGVVEENGNIECKFKIELGQYTMQNSTTVYLRTDERDVLMSEAIGGIGSWWADDLEMTPCRVPSDATDPCYSFWYSYHQNMTSSEVEKECERAKELGFKTVIVDDGWQTADSSGGYAYCGDWEAAPEKFPDMKKHIENVHKLGMKYVLWFSVPFVGKYSKNYEKFKGKYILSDDEKCEYTLDPRYKEVRDFLISLYKNRLLEWDLDGFKLDFVDFWQNRKDNAPVTDEMDIPVLYDAVDTLMTEIRKTLTEIKPDIMLEFRQTYTGPNMRKYGNMFRVGDCPLDYISNRIGIFDLRMIMGESAVHSDMLMWHKDEKPENAALQIISIIYGVMQYSAKLSDMNDDMKKMSKFWFNFMEDHKETLLKGKLIPYEAEKLYTWAKSDSDKECIVSVYEKDKAVKPTQKKTIYILNGCMGERVIVDILGEYEVNVYNCMGNLLKGFDKKFEGISEIEVPVGGIIKLSSKN